MKEQRLASLQPDKADPLELHHFALHFGGRRLYDAIGLRAVRPQQLQRCARGTPLHDWHALDRVVASVLEPAVTQPAVAQVLEPKQVALRQLRHVSCRQHDGRARLDRFTPLAHLGTVGMKRRVLPSSTRQVRRPE